jgi:hypothetical protein
MLQLYIYISLGMIRCFFSVLFTSVSVPANRFWLLWISRILGYIDLSVRCRVLVASRALIRSVSKNVCLGSSLVFNLLPHVHSFVDHPFLQTKRD